MYRKIECDTMYTAAVCINSYCTFACTCLVFATFPPIGGAPCAGRLTFEKSPEPAYLRFCESTSPTRAASTKQAGPGSAATASLATLNSTYKIKHKQKCHEHEHPPICSRALHLPSGGGLFGVSIPTGSRMYRRDEMSSSHDPQPQKLARCFGRAASALTPSST